jgi:hypothetical protein
MTSIYGPDGTLQGILWHRTGVWYAETPMGHSRSFASEESARQWLRRLWKERTKREAAA